MVDRLAEQWDDASCLTGHGPFAADPADLTPAAWRNRTLGVLAGFALATLLLLWLAPHMPTTYRPYGGIVGTPAWFDRSPTIELWFYFLGLLAYGGLGWLGGWYVGRDSRRGRLAVLAVVATAAVFIVGHHTRWIPSSQASSLLRDILKQPVALVELVLLAGAGWWLSLPGRLPGRPPRRVVGRARPVSPPGWEAFLTASRFVPCFLLFALTMGAAMPRPVAGLLLAFPLALLAEFLLRPTDDPQRSRHLTQTLERWAWRLLAFAPFAAWLRRLAITLGYSPSPKLMLAGGLTVVLLPLAAGGWRCRLGWAPEVRTERLLPWALIWAMLLAAGCAFNYDGFHQGEFTYPFQALRRGLLPWRDIFYVHGFGIDTLGGWLMRTPTPRLHSLETSFHGFVEMLAAFVALEFLLRAWGRPWWPAALLTAGLTAVGAHPYGRYAVPWILLFMAHGFLRERRLRWMAMAGVVAAIGPFYALDTGALGIVGFGLWALLWGFAAGGRRVSFQTTMGRTYPLLAFLAGVALVAVPALVAMLHFGLVRETWRLHLDYLAVKPHYDKLPFNLDCLSALAAPAGTILGCWATADILRRRQCGPLAGLIPLLTIFNLLAFLRAFDRSDSGHIAYATILAWPLLGTLAVWRHQRGHEFEESDHERPTPGQRTMLDTSAARRALLFGVMLIALPYTHHPIGRPPQPGAQPPTGSIHLYWHYYGVFVHRPLIVPIGSEPGSDPYYQAFFDVADRVRDITEAPGAGSTRLVRSFYDFSNQPAIYTWTGLTAPARFFTAYHSSSLRWQREVIDALEGRPVTWVLWRGPSLFWNAPDGMPNWLRQWRIAQYLLRYYRPERQLGTRGPPLLIDNRPQPGFALHDGLLLRRTGLTPPGLEAQPLAPLWLSGADLGEVPAVWGRGGDGVPAAPQYLIVRADLTLTSESTATMSISRPLSLVRAIEASITVTPPVDGRCVIRWDNVAGESLGRSMSFHIHADHGGSYRLPLASNPAWVWGGAPANLRIEIQTASPPPEKVRFDAWE
jgi:hypothetical protein